MIMLNKDYKKEQNHQTNEKGFLESDKFFFLIVFSIFISPKLFLCGIAFIFLRFLYLCIALKYYQTKAIYDYCDEVIKATKESFQDKVNND